MLPAAARMRRRDEFTTAVREGRRAGRPGLVIHLYADGRGGVRVGFVIPRAVGPAVVRNRVRRRLRHLLRDRLDQFPPGSLVVVRVLPPAAAMNNAVLGAELDRLVAKVRRARGDGATPVRSACAVTS